VHWWWLTVAAAGLVIVGWASAVARSGVGPRETAVFEAVNGLPGFLYWVLWLPMQLGNLVVGLAAGLVVALVVGSVTVAVGVVLATVLKLVVERAVRAQLADQLAERQRPGTSEPHAVLRGRDVPSSGPSFPSGHVILVAGIACVVAPHLPVTWWWVPLAATFLVMLGRVYVGAHNPLDVVAGLGAGLILGGIVAIFIT
jgi:membrane-associated phospholipid phosphatase